MPLHGGHNQLHFNLSCPPSTKNIESVCKKPSVITVQKVKSDLQNDADICKQVIGTIVDNGGGGEGYTSQYSSNFDTAVKLAKRDLKNKRLLDLATELGLLDDEEEKEVSLPKKKEKSVKKAKTKTLNISRSNVTKCSKPAKKTEAKVQASCIPSTSKDLNTNSVVRRSEGTGQFQHTKVDILNSREDSIIADLRRSHSQLYEQLEQIAEAIRCLTQKMAINTPSPKSRGASLFLDKDEGIIRRRLRLDEQNVRSARTIYFLSRQVHDIQRDYQLRKDSTLSTQHDKCRALSRITALVRGCTRCAQTFSTFIQDMVPSDCLTIDLCDLFCLLKKTVKLICQVDPSDLSIQSVTQTKSLIKFIQELSEVLQQKINAKFLIKKKKSLKVPKQNIVKKKILKQKPGVAGVPINSMFEPYFSHLKKDVIKHIKQETNREKVARFRTSLDNVGLQPKSKPSYPPHFTTKVKQPKNAATPAVKRKKVNKPRSGSRRSCSDNERVTRSRSSSVSAHTIASMRRSISAPPSRESFTPWKPAGVVAKPVVKNTHIIDNRLCKSHSFSDISMVSEPSISQHAISILKRTKPKNSYQHPDNSPVLFTHQKLIHDNGKYASHGKHRQKSDRTTKLKDSRTNTGNVVVDSSIETMIQRLEHLQAEQDSIRSRWNNYPVRKSLSSINATQHSMYGVASPGIINQDDLITTSPCVINPPAPSAITFTRHGTKSHTTTTSINKTVTKGPLILHIPQDSIDNIYRYATQNKIYSRPSYSSSGVIDPWILTQHVCDEILDDCINEVTSEIDAISTNIVDHICSTELTLPTGADTRIR